ncbi:integrase catalytic domain-containing protein [Trichonephila clavipes]|uniref:Integrase catalytic domain-containing protein n=1 Tax=Trichonephila clavipes TaxID=2585209 RepID=A0A8X6WHE7_TRICX|nr:integrase catalytic domain-containing protein [Trichonephila clavipes]
MRDITKDGPGVAFNMPHHGVYHPEKSTTKLRTVFNASSPSTSGKSLNSIQFNGGLVEEDFSIILRFRKHRFIDNCRSKVKKREPLTTSEVNNAEIWLIKQDQSGINLSEPSSNLKSFNIFQDDKGVLRIGGRLEKASIPYSQKHPAILSG